MQTPKTKLMVWLDPYCVYFVCKNKLFFDEYDMNLTFFAKNGTICSKLMSPYGDKLTHREKKQPWNKIMELHGNN